MRVLTRVSVLFAAVLILAGCGPGRNSSASQAAATAPALTRDPVQAAPKLTNPLRPAVRATAPSSGAGSVPTVRPGKRIPETHAGRTQCLTCHEFGTVGPPMPQFHKDDKYDNPACKSCHAGP